MIENVISTLKKQRIFKDLFNYEVVYGGSINQTYSLLTDAGKFFVKCQSSCPSDFFECEKEGLEVLNEHVFTPNIIFQSEKMLVLEWLNLSDLKNEKEAKEAGKALAKLHRETSNNIFGFDQANYIGSLTQTNSKQKEGKTFYINCRWKPLVESVFREDERLKETLLEKLNALVEQLPEEQPCLLHGDLWSGNIGVCNGKVYFFDPSVYYGYRETDLAMARLFGGFPEAFFKSYNIEFPLLKGWKERISLFQLYPVLVHAKLFGGAYKDQAAQLILGRLT